MAWDNEKTNKRFTKRLHGGSDEYGEFWGPEAQQQETFHYAFYEVELDCEVDLDTGKVRCWGVQGSPLQDPVEV